MADRRRLVITRRPGETFDLHFDGDVKVTVTVAEVRGNHVRHRIEAPPSVTVIRDDVVATPPNRMVGRRIET